jgi:hypothetical protein
MTDEPKQPQPFTRSLGPGRYHINPISRGPWDPNSLHARVLAGLFGHEVEVNYAAGGDFHVARLTIDLYRLPTLAPCEVTSRYVREGNRIRVVEVEYLSEGTSYARGTAVLLKRTDNPTGTVWSPPDWDAPAPDALPERDPGTPPGGWEPMWETKPITSRDPQNIVQGKAWLRETRPLVEGVELTPFVRAASAADWTNPAANWGSNGLEFINADITLYLHRYPAGEWVGFEVSSHHSADGVAVGHCTMYDEQGAIGSSSVCALAQRRSAGWTPPAESTRRD